MRPRTISNSHILDKECSKTPICGRCHGLLRRTQPADVAVYLRPCLNHGRATASIPLVGRGKTGQQKKPSTKGKKNLSCTRASTREGCGAHGKNPARTKASCSTIPALRPESLHELVMAAGPQAPLLRRQSQAASAWPSPMPSGWVGRNGASMAMLYRGRSLCTGHGRRRHTQSRAARVGQGSDGLQQLLVGGDSLYQAKECEGTPAVYHHSGKRRGHTGRPRCAKYFALGGSSPGQLAGRQLQGPVAGILAAHEGK